jgi:hypothetical protein
MNTNTKPHLQRYKWERGNVSPNPQGRPKMLKTMLKNECSLTPTQTNDAILSLLMHTKSEIEHICNDDTQPMFNRIISKALIKSYHNGTLYALESLLNRTQGLPKQQTELTTFKEQPIFVGIDLDIT